MTSRQTLYLSAGLLIIWFLITTILRSDLGSHIRYFSDDYDRGIYFERGAWLKTGQVPYRDVISEYPQVPTFLFGLLHIPFLGEKNDLIAYLKYSALFSLAMLIILFALINLLHQLLPNAKYRSFLLLLPAPLYFTLNRYDVLPAYLCVLSLAMIRDKKWGVAAIILGIAAMTKWYPILLLPAYLAYFYRVEGSINWRIIALFSVTCFLIILPTLLLGGINAVLVPYRFQGIRGLETLSLPALISRLERSVSPTPIEQRYYIFGFLLLQVIASVISFFARIDKFEKLLMWCILIITTFILFARIYSPQWCLWILPLLILVAKNKIDVAFIVAYGSITYLGFPIMFDTYGQTATQMIYMSLVNLILLTLIAVRTIAQLRSFSGVRQPSSLLPN